MERHAQLNLALQIHQSDENLIGAMGHTMYRPRVGDFGDGACTKGQPFYPQAKDQDADRFAMELAVVFVVPVSFDARILFCRAREPSGPAGEISLWCRAVEKGPRCCGKHMTVSTMNKCF